MSFHPYQNYDEPRTASREAMTVKSIQAWKAKKVQAPPEIITALNKAGDNNSESFDNVLMAYAPPKYNSKTQTENFNMGSVIDVINPLQHIPFISTAYRELTRDKLHPLSGIIGGALYGGPIGAVSGTINAIAKMQTGQDIGQHALAVFKPNHISTLV